MDITFNLLQVHELTALICVSHVYLVAFKEASEQVVSKGLLSSIVHEVASTFDIKSQVSICSLCSFVLP